MKVKGLSGLIAAVCVLTCAVGMAQTRPAATRYYTSTYGTPAGGHYQVGFHHGGGCTDCGDPAPSCGCNVGCGAPGCYRGGCGCCPRILPAVARGVGAVADFVGSTLDCIFCVPDGGCGCGTRRGCCLRRPYCGGCGGCGGCGMESDCCGDGGVISSGVPMEAVPSGPPMPTEARVIRPHTTTRTSAAPRTQVARTQVARKTAPIVRRPQYASAPASAVEELPRSKAAPRELSVDETDAVALNPFDDETAPVQRVAPTSVKASGRSVPANPLR
ncbi:MAG: hypothetical protein U0935_00255 [Pirellulales bacterium]